MVAKKKAIKGGQIKKLKLRKETLKDLMPRKSAADRVKGGNRMQQSGPYCSF